MNRKDEAHQLARRYPGGIEALALRMGVAAGRLRKKLTGVEGYPLDVDDEDAIVDFCLSANVPYPLAPLTAQAVNRGALLIWLPEGAEIGRSGSLSDLARCAKEFGEFAGTVASAAADRRISDNELKDIEREGGKLVARIQDCLVTARRENEASKPPSATA